MTKNQLRSLALDKRNSLTKDQIQTWSNQICDKIIGSPEFQNANIIHIYKSFGSEVQTEQIIQKAFEASKTVVIPKANSDQSLSYWQIFPTTIFEIDRFGIESPSENCQAFDTTNLKPNDLIIIPMVAFDSKHNRIGYGKGYYDQFLENITCNKIGLAFGVQKVVDFEPDSWEIPLDQIIQN